MKIIVCVKQVPETNAVKIDPVKNTLVRSSARGIINYEDESALEEALKIKDANLDTEIVVLSMGPTQAEDSLRECLAIGADDAILLSDRKFAGSDTWATSNCLAAAIKRIGSFDLIITGRRAIDGDTAQVGPQLAEKLNIPQVTYVNDMKIDNNRITAKMQLEDGYEIIEAEMPCLVTVTRNINNPRDMTVSRIFDAFEKKITAWDMAVLDLNDEEVGLEASPTKVHHIFTPMLSRKGTIYRGESSEKMVGDLIYDLKIKN